VCLPSSVCVGSEALSHAHNQFALPWAAWSKSFECVTLLNERFD
ncbi:uncharacterized protein METZ01_LOCUS459994, partial [marine metagenome]